MRRGVSVAVLRLRGWYLAGRDPLQGKGIARPQHHLLAWRNWQRTAFVMRGLWVRLPSPAFFEQ